MWPGLRDDENAFKLAPSVGLFREETDQPRSGRVSKVLLEILLKFFDRDEAALVRRELNLCRREPERLGKDFGQDGLALGTPGQMRQPREFPAVGPEASKMTW